MRRRHRAGFSTEAGQRAWDIDEVWRGYAMHAMSVAERRRLLDEAEHMQLPKVHESQM
jgi:hypothetical protein